MRIKRLHQIHYLFYPQNLRMEKMMKWQMKWQMNEKTETIRIAFARREWQLNGMHRFLQCVRISIRMVFIIVYHCILWLVTMMIHIWWWLRWLTSKDSNWHMWHNSFFILAGCDREKVLHFGQLSITYLGTKCFSLLIFDHSTYSIEWIHDERW